MILTKFTYETQNLESLALNSYALSTLEFGKLNLLVGKNGSGKSTISSLLDSLAGMLSNSYRYIGKWRVEWLDEENKTTYQYSCERNFVTNGVKVYVEEKLTKNGITLLFERKDDHGKIFSFTSLILEKINPPTDKQILSIRRDEVSYPDLEKIAKWADGVHSFRFAHIHAPTFQDAFNKRSLPTIKEKPFNEILGELDAGILKNIVQDFNQFSYQLEELIVKKEGLENILYVKELKLKFPLRYHDLSQGMFRSLSLLIYIHYLIEKENAQLIIIDDLCEGLDYDRATRLGKILFNRMNEKGVQFIATSNDSFLMNVVDIEYWNVIHREGDTIKSFNYHNSFDKFEEFKTIGLNNFELFSSNFLAKE